MRIESDIVGETIVPRTGPENVTLAVSQHHLMQLCLVVYPRRTPTHDEDAECIVTASGTLDCRFGLGRFLRYHSRERAMQASCRSIGLRFCRRKSAMVRDASVTTVPMGLREMIDGQRLRWATGSPRVR